MKDSSTLILIPTYNEKGAVPRLVSDILELDLDLDVLFVDDNSPDGTGQLLDALAERNDSLRVLHRPQKLGVGSAHLDGIRWAYDHGYTTLVSMDADFAHRPQHIVDLVERARESDVVIGSRYLPGGSMKMSSVRRRLLALVGHTLTRVVLGMAYDATGAYRAYRLDAVPRQVFELVRSKGYSFFLESLYILHRNGFRIQEVPIVAGARTEGNSKMRPSDALNTLATLTSIFLASLFNSARFEIRREAGGDAA